MMALLRYGNGFPWNRLENLEDSLGIPLPAATQCQIMAETAVPLQPALEELKRQAAQGEVVHHDDTSMRVRERVRAGWAHARQNGKKLGRPITAGRHTEQVRKLYRTGVSKSEIARRLQIGRTSVRRILAQVRHGPVGKRPNAFRISSGDRRVCTTFWSTFEMFRQADAELVQQGFLFQRRFRDPAEAALSPICGG
jgi:hypothetical protein